MKRKDVDDPTLPIDREGCFRGQYPWRASEESRGSLMQRGVPGIEHPVEIATAPSRQEIDPNLEFLGDPQNDGQAEAAQMAAFDARDHRLRDPGRDGDVDLAPPLANPHRAKDRSQSSDVHVAESATAALSSPYRPIIRRQTAMRWFGRIRGQIFLG